MASYKVKNEAGQEFEVDEEKIGEAEKDGFLPVVTNGKQEHRVSFNDIKLAKKDGFLPKSDSSFLEAKDTFFDNLNQMIPGSGLIDKAAAATNAGIQEIGDLFRDDGNKKEFKDRYQQYLNTQDIERKVMDEKYPVASTAGTVAGIVPNLAIPVPFGKAGGLVGAGQRIMANTAISAADSATRNKDELIDEEAGFEGGALAGSINTAIEAMPYVGKGIKAAKRLLPATEGALDSVNKATAAIGSLIPGTDIKSDELFELLKDVKGRRVANKLAGDKNMSERVYQETAAALKHLDELTGDQATDIYKAAENSFLEKVTKKDINKMMVPIQQIKQQQEIINKRPELFGRAKRVIDNVSEIIERGNVGEIGEATADKPLKDLFDILSPKETAEMYGRRLLGARRYIDDVTKNVDYDKMLQSERDQIVLARKFINDSLDSINAAKKLREADQFYSDFVKQKKDAFAKLETPLPGGGREFTPEKMAQFYKSEAAQAKFIQRELAALGELMASQGVEGSDAARRLSDTVSGLKKHFSTGNDFERLKRATGGPSSQAINTAAQIWGAVQTGGASLLALPFTNPAGWMRLVDGASSLGEKEFLKKVGEASKELASRYPGMAARMYVMDKQLDD